MPLDPQPDQPAAVIAAVLAGGGAVLEEAAAGLAELLGPLKGRSPVYAFSAFTRYYENEMGPDLVKQILWFEPPVPPDRLAAIKEQTIALERQLGRQVGDAVCRRANIDPGLVSPHSLVLATTKPSGHRICIAPGLFAEVTLLYERGRYRPLPWTYRDFRSDAAQALVQQIREYLLQQRAP